MGFPDAEPRPPRFPRRLQWFEYGCAMAADAFDSGKNRPQAFSRG